MYPYTPTRMVKFKGLIIPNAAKDVEKNSHIGRTIKFCNRYRKDLAVSYKLKHIITI